MAEDVRGRIRDFITSRVGPRRLDDRDDIFALGYVNSLFAMQLAVFVEKELGGPLEPADLRIENFRSIEDMARLVESKSTSLSKP
jgi:acyl carrier protein